MIMGVYNGARFLQEAVESVLGQTLQDLEFIVIDDGSTDESREILHSIKDPRLRVKRQERLGLTAALVAGADEAKGEYLGRQDADDISEPGRLQAQIEYMTNHPDVVLLGTWASVIDQDDETIGNTIVETSPSILEGQLCSENQFVHGSILMRRDVYFAAGGYRRAFRYAQDYDLALRMGERGQLANLPYEWYRHRMRPDMISMREHQRQIWYRDLARKLHEERRLNGEDRLEKGQVIEEPGELESTVAGDGEAASDRYRSRYIYTCLRHGKVIPARRALREAIASKPLQFRSYMSYFSTFLGSTVTRRLYHAWDQWRKSC